MIGTIVNTLALLVGTSIGCLVKKGINKRYEDVLFIAMGLAALGIGWKNVTNTMLFTNATLDFVTSMGFWRKLRLRDAGCCSRSILLARQHLSRCQIFIGKLFYRSTSNRDFHCGRLLNCLFRVSPVKNS